jgi:hypothetical protein
MMPLTPEREAQLEEYARRHGKDFAAALDEVLAEALEWELQARYGQPERGGQAKPANEVITDPRWQKRPMR